MQDTVLAKISNTQNSILPFENALKNNTGVEHLEQYQVDNASTVSTSSCQEESSDEDETIVVSNETALPTIESLSVVNSSDVHIGNKTVYKGPVTIKQIVYPNGAIASDCVNNLERCENKVTVKPSSVFPANGGIDNPTYVKDSSSLQNKDNADKEIIQNGDAQAQHVLTDTGIGKGFLWLRNLPKKHTRNIVIFFSIVIVAITILTAVIYWRHPLPSEKNGYDGDTDEQDNNTPIEYSSDSNATINERLHIVPRLQWLAQPPTNESSPLKLPVSMVIIQHTATETCISTAQCVYIVRHVQQFHIESNQWWDIGYNFLVGGDGLAYEGRGWKIEGAHTFGYNYKSIGVAFIGTFTSHLPAKNQIVAFHKLVAKGIELGYINKDYKILGARQLQATESPGALFMREIETWPHWSKTP